MKKTRPALVIQNDIANAVSPNTIVAAIHHENFKRLPVHVSVPAGMAGLTKNSVIDLGYIRTIPQRVLGRKIGSLPEKTVAAVEQAIRISFGLAEINA